MIIVLNMNNTIITLMLIFDKISAIKRLIASKINIYVYIIGLYVCIFIMQIYIMYKYIHIQYIS